MPDDSPPVPGTVEYAAAAKQAFSDRFARMKAGMPGGDDLVTLIFACAYDNRQGYCFGCDGEPNDLVNVMAITLIELADRVREKIGNAEKFLPPAQRTPYARILSDVVNQLIVTVSKLSHDNALLNPSGIILPDAHDSTK